MEGEVKSSLRSLVLMFFFFQRKRETAASMLWSDLEKRASLMTGYAERLEQRVGPDFNIKNEGETVVINRTALKRRHRNARQP